MFVVTEAPPPRSTPSVSQHHRQRAGTRVRPDHRRVEAAAAAAGEADAETAAVTAGALTPRRSSSRRPERKIVLLG
jgi:hypothetical protein